MKKTQEILTDLSWLFVLGTWQTRHLVALLLLQVLAQGSVLSKDNLCVCVHNAMCIATHNYCFIEKM